MFSSDIYKSSKQTTVVNWKGKGESKKQRPTIRNVNEMCLRYCSEYYAVLEWDRKIAHTNRTYIEILSYLCTVNDISFSGWREWCGIPVCCGK